MRPNQLRQAKPGLGLLLFLSLLVACRPMNNELASAMEETVPANTAQPVATDPPTDRPAESPLAIEDGSGETTKLDTGEARANADVEFVRAVQAVDGSWTFYVTVRHPDSGWEDYADGWDVLTPDGSVIKRNSSDPFTRLLLHPHESEQPFTRSQSGLVIPIGVNQVIVRAHDLVDGFGGRQVVVDLNTGGGLDFSIERR